MSNRCYYFKQRKKTYTVVGYTIQKYKCGVFVTTWSESLPENKPNTKKEESKDGKEES